MTLHPFRQAIWGDTRKCTVEKSQTNATDFPSSRAGNLRTNMLYQNTGILFSKIPVSVFESNPGIPVFSGIPQGPVQDQPPHHPPQSPQCHPLHQPHESHQSLGGSLMIYLITDRTLTLLSRQIHCRQSTESALRPWWSPEGLPGPSGHWTKREEFDQKSGTGNIGELHFPPQASQPELLVNLKNSSKSIQLSQNSQVPVFQKI